MLRTLVVLATVLLGFTSPAAAQIQDGGFDGQGGTVSDYCVSTACPAGAWVTSGAVGAGSGLIHQGSTAWPAPTSVTPSTIAYVQSTGVLQQTFTAAASGQHRLSYWVSGRQALYNYAGNQSLSVTINGVLVSQSTTTTGSPFKRYISAPFALASGQSVNVKFAGGSATDNSAFIDSVAIIAATELTSYTYDALGRLTGVSTVDGTRDGLSSTYVYDKTGNRSTVSVQGAN